MPTSAISHNPKNPANPRDFKTPGFILRRTNYGESDRILSLITPLGKISALARGARKAKSKLAGGIELFTRSEFNLHQGSHNPNSNQDRLAILTSAKMQKFYSKIISDYARLNLASDLLKKINAASESSTSPEYFALIDQSFSALNNIHNPDLVEAWFLINLKRISGDELNLYRDRSGAKLTPDQTYSWDPYDRAFAPDPNGNFSPSAIKLLRLMTTSDLALLLRVKFDPDLLPPILSLLRQNVL